MIDNPATYGAHRRFVMIALGGVVFLALLRLVFLGAIDLLPEEAYYWNYSRHLDYGYLDHPPVVAWMIAATTSWMGHTELAVRLPAWLAWFAGAYFLYLYARNMAGPAAARVTLLLYSALPYFFAIGFIITPDTPLVVCWAGCLLFLERALVSGDRRAWWAAGACMGVGFLSKYTIVLLGPAAVVFMLLDPQARRWWRRPEPYAASLLAILLFMPVVVWNADHDWISFGFQSVRRFRSHHFSTQWFLLHVLTLLTPVGMAAVWLALRGKDSSQPDDIPDDTPRRQLRFVRVFVAVPLLVFFLASLRQEVKFNWTGPIWLAALPLVAGAMQAVRRPRWLLPAWKGTFAALFLLCPAALLYLSVGIPGVPYPSHFRLPISWRELGAAIEKVEEQLEEETGQEPLIVGMDTNHLSSELAFYDPNGDGSEETAGSGLFLRKDVMYSLWFTSKIAEGRTIIAVSYNEDPLKRKSLLKRVERTDPIVKLPIIGRDGRTRYIFYRLLYGYKMLPATTPAATKIPTTQIK